LETDSIPLPDPLIWDLSFYPLNWISILVFLALAFLIICTALISGSEVAFFSLTPSDKSIIRDSKKKTHNIIRDLLSVPDKLLTTVLVANVFVKVSIVILSTYLVHKTINVTNTPVLGFVFEILAITFILLLFSEILPKIWASKTPMRVAEFMARPINLLSKILSPISFIFIKTTSIVTLRQKKHNQNISIDEISQALELTDEEELSDDKGILEGIIKFGSTDVDQIMTPRIDVIAIEINETFDEIINVINESGYSRIPVYNETFDNIEGVLYIKDLLLHLQDQTDFRWQTLIRPTYYVPENKKIDDLLKEFQKTKVHMAIVVDEYGGTSGIVTLEDILEEIVGDITDEFDDDDQLYSKINDYTFIFDGKTQLNDFYRICDIDNDLFDDIKGEADTLAGLLLEMKGNFTKQGEILKYKNIDFITESLDKRRIKKIKVVFNNN